MTQKASIFQAVADLLPELADLEHSQAGPRSPRSGRPTTDTSRLPFGIAIDDPDEPADALTVAGINRWTWQWAHALRQARHDPADVFTYLSPHDYLTHNTEWAQSQWADWECVLDEAQRIHARLARRTGHAPIRYGWCSCGGSVWQEATDSGLTDWMVCDGPAEHFYRDATHYAATQLWMARAVTEPGRYWVRMAAIKTIWPSLDRRTLHSWVERGHVTKRSNTYDLAQINARAARLHTEESPS